ncbi:hypothetical protein [Streptomyces sp. SID13031]|uniref:hypothetical protein n=1 Tax=Streptomyces sp. SID13031 TaxID=2706046 RepID=UPI0013CB2DFC|nr:hypothetical protein [Streptomyces sp. SID13031]NEA32269.1 hypothetical protein [Streptomyces sp. SID13031]
MNPTDEVDDLLAKAGAQWRATQPSAPEPDLDRITGTEAATLAARSKRRWLVPTLAAASVAAIAVAALTVLPDHNEPAVAPAPSSTPQIAEGAVQGKAGADDLLVRNGDKVEVEGKIMVAPGQGPIFCAPQMEAMPAPLIEPATEPPAPHCRPENSIKLIGVDLDRLTDPKTTQGVRTGLAQLIGIWKDRTITVEEQKPGKVQPVRQPGDAANELPCPEPAGGWPSLASNLDSKRVQNFLTANADQVYGPIMSYPHGSSRGAPVVVRLGVAHADVAAFRKLFETIYDGNLCMYPTKLSVTDSQRISDAIGNLMATRKELGIQTGGGQGADGDHVQLAAVVLDETLKTALEPLGLEYLDLEVDVKPVR